MRIANGDAAPFLSRGLPDDQARAAAGMLTSEKRVAWVIGTRPLILIVVVTTRSDSYPVRRFCLSDQITRSSSPDRSVCRLRTSPSACVHSTSYPGACAHGCTARSTRQDPSAAPRGSCRSSCGRRPDRTHSGSSCGTARRSHWSAVTEPWCVSPSAVAVLRLGDSMHGLKIGVPLCRRDGGTPPD